MPGVESGLVFRRSMCSSTGEDPRQLKFNRNCCNDPSLLSLSQKHIFWVSPPCSVESSNVNWKKKKSGGIKIICQSDMRDFSAMAFITDHVNSLIDQWFPGKNYF